MSTTGWSLGYLLIGGSALLTIFSLHLLSLCATKVEYPSSFYRVSVADHTVANVHAIALLLMYYVPLFVSYLTSLCPSQVTNASIPSCTFLVDASVASMCFGVAISYLIGKCFAHMNFEYYPRLCYVSLSTCSHRRADAGCHVRHRSERLHDGSHGVGAGR